VRVVAGTARGRKLVLPRVPEVRPTTGRVREALMSVLGPRLPGARVLDLFAGSGALAIEALSRGADHAVLVERDHRTVAVIRRNLETCELTSGATLVRADALRYLATAARKNDPPFDIVLLDPPYASPLGQRAVDEVAANDLLAPGGILVLEHAPGAVPACPAGLALGRTSAYGDSCLTYMEPGGD